MSTAQAALARCIAETLQVHRECDVSLTVISGAGLGSPHTADPETGEVTLWGAPRDMQAWCKSNGLRFAGANTQRGTAVFQRKERP